ncbi:MAG TPA: minor capsid protein, partial [Ferruginibacter sp.]|nr:minor capsid protein [Ferruginibacter sp.]
MAMMQYEYASCCNHHTHIVNADNDELDKLSTDIARKLYKFKQMPPGIGRKLTLQYAMTLWEGVVKGYGYNVEDLQYDSPDQNMLLNLQSNVYAFAGAKTWHQMQHLTKALIDPETSKIRSFREFKIEADKINKWYSKTALNAEYNTAIAGAQMASKWVEIQEQGDPMLEFDAVMDGQTTDLCRSLNGVTLPSSDPFWQQYYPPNHFACRSTVRISYGRTPTNRSTIVYPDKMPDMFKTNLAQTGVIFPPNHSAGISPRFVPGW